MAEPRKDRGDTAFSIAAGVLALVPRLYVAIAWAREPVWDGHYYDFGAKRIAAGLGYSDDVVTPLGLVWHPWCHYPVGYSGFLGFVYSVFGSGPHVATIANALVGGLTAVVVHRLARLAMSPARARIAAVLVALSPGLIVYSALLMTEPLAGFLLVAAAWLSARDRETHPLRGAAVGGAVLGLATLVRPQTLLVAPLLGLLVFAPTFAGEHFWARARRAFSAATLASVCALGVVLPWTARNCAVMDGCALVSTNGGWNLAIGAFPRATGRFETLRSTDGCKVVTGQVQQDRCWWNKGVTWIKEDPSRWFSLMPKKLGFTFDHESFPIGYLAEADPASWPEERRALGRSVLTVSYLLLLSVAALGVVARPGRKSLWAFGPLTLVVGLALWGAEGDTHVFWPLAVLIPLLWLLPIPKAPKRDGVFAFLVLSIASVVVTHAVFFGEDRYHMVLTPVLALLAAGALRPAAEGGEKA